MLDYPTRAHRFTLKVDRNGGAISRFKIVETVRFTDPGGLRADPTAAVARREALNGLDPSRLNGDASVLGRSSTPRGWSSTPGTAT